LQVEKILPLVGGEGDGLIFVAHLRGTDDLPRSEVKIFQQLGKLRCLAGTE
jgi:hypothetical protein